MEVYWLYSIVGYLLEEGTEYLERNKQILLVRSHQPNLKKVLWDHQFK